MATCDLDPSRSHGLDHRRSRSQDFGQFWEQGLDRSCVEVSYEGVSVTTVVLNADARVREVPRCG